MIAIVTGSNGLVGAATVRALIDDGYNVVGFDNDMRAEFFGPEASTAKQEGLLQNYAWDRDSSYFPLSVDVGSWESVEAGYEQCAYDDDGIGVVVHCAAQPSHDWAASDPLVDFQVNANGTLHMLEATRKFCPKAAFVQVSTNKVYGTVPNNLTYRRTDRRFEPIDPKWKDGFDETMSVDHTTHSLFGASKLSGDIVAQEYGRYFGMNVAVFRCGCLTGGDHAGAQQHGFLAYLVKTAVANEPYTVFGYEGYQVRDNLHADDLAQAFMCWISEPKGHGRVYNMGGGVANACSVREAIGMVEERGYRHRHVDYGGTGRKGDHRWWVTDTQEFERDYPEWQRKWSLDRIVDELVQRHERKQE